MSGTQHRGAQRVRSSNRLALRRSFMSAPHHLSVEDRPEVAVDKVISTAAVVAGVQNCVFEVMIRVLVHDRSSGIQQMLQPARDCCGRGV